MFHLVQNAKRIEEFIENIEQNFIPGLQSGLQYTGRSIIGRCSEILTHDGLLESKRGTIYGGNVVHPSTLTQTERLRVIRACYQIWSSTYCREDTIRAKVRSLRPRELFYLAELAEWARAVKFPGRHAGETFQIVKSAGNAVYRFYLNTHRRGAPRFESLLASSDDPVGLFAIWDHWQDNLKNLICGKPLSTLQRDAQAETMECLWDYEAGDELLIVED